MGQLTLKCLISKSNNSTWHNATVTIVCLVMLGKKGKNESGLNPRSGLKKKFFYNTTQYYCDNSLFSNVQFNPWFGLEKKFLPAPFQLLRLRFQIISLLPEIFFHAHYENYYKSSRKNIYKIIENYREKNWGTKFPTAPSPLPDDQSPEIDILSRGQRQNQNGCWLS